MTSAWYSEAQNMLTISIDIRRELLDEHRRQREQKQRILQNQLDTAKVKK